MSIAKKLLFALITSTLVFGLAACGGEKEGEGEGDDTTNESTEGGEGGGQ